MSKALAKWKEAKPPNYETNKDKLYPYSELPYQCEYELIKIPICVKNLIEHVDYFGEGKIVTDYGTRGFPDCYNVNYEYDLVRDGPDKGRKIPNRIPINEKSFSTRNYIKDNSVLTVTVNLLYDLDMSVVKDIVRIVNSDRGKVIIYGANDFKIEMVADELMKIKQLYYCPIYLLPDKLQSTAYKTNVRAYLCLNELMRDLYRNVYKGDLEAAVILTACLTNAYCGSALSDVVIKLIENNIRNVFVYAHKLWNNNSKDIVCEHFPPVFQQIFNGEYMAIINKQYNQALMLEPTTTRALGDGQYKSSNKLGWKIIPIWDDNNVLFKLYNIDSNMYLQLSPAVDDNGDRQTCGSEDSKELRDKFYLEPLIMNGQVAFTILNCDYDKLLELPADVDSSQDKEVVGLKCVGKDGSSKWMLAASSDVKEKDELKRTQSIDILNNKEYCNIYNSD